MIIRSKAPLRLGFAGGGTDVSPFCDEFGGYVLNATINMYAYCTLEEIDEEKIIFNAVDRDESFECELTNRIELDGYLDLHKGVYNRVVRDFNNDQPLKIRMTTHSDAPAGSGLGSSSTMVVSILKAYVEYLNLPLGEYDIAHLAYEIEREDIKLAGGKQDQYAATFGGFNFMEFYQDHVIVNPLRIKHWIIDELESSIVLYNTGTSRESATIIKEQSSNVVKKNTKSVEALKQLKVDCYDMKSALLRGDFKSLASVLERSWESKKKTAHSITNERINNIYNKAIEAGAYSGKISGAGGGGFMMFLVDPVKKLNVIKVLESMDGTVYNIRFVDRGASGWKIPK